MNMRNFIPIQFISESAKEKYLRRALPSKSDNREHVVYWLHNSSCFNPGFDGYVGVTIGYREKTRFLEHSRSGRFPVDIKIQILSRGFAETCYLYEAVLRPHANIGWNIAAGGARGNKSGIPKSEITRQRIGAANRGKIRPDLAERNRQKTGPMTKVECPHCGKIGAGPTMQKYHFNRCKQK